MAKTLNYNWPLPSPIGIQMTEIGKIASAISGIDSTFAAFEQRYSTHTHSFGDLQDRPTTLGGYGITDGMTAQEIAAAIKKATDDLINGSGAALDTLKELADALDNNPNFAASVSTALGFRVRVDAAQSFSSAQKAQARTNIDALGTSEKGAINGLAPLGSDQKVPQSYLLPQTTTATVGAAVAGAAGRQSIADGDTLTGVLAGTSTLVRWTWGNIKAWLQAVFDTRYFKQIGGTVSGTIISSAADALRIANGGKGVIFRKDSTKLYVLISDTETGSWNNLRPWRVDLATGAVEIGNGLAVSGPVSLRNGLEVTGAIRASGFLYADGAEYQTNGNIVGSIWQNWGAGDAWSAISNRIEQRAREYADDRLNQARAYADDRGYWRTRDYMLGENFPVGGYIMARKASDGNVGAGGTIGGADLIWSDSGNGGSAVVNFGTWLVCGNIGRTTASVCKRIG